MPPFHYDTYQNPFVGSIADLIQAPGRAQAQAALTSGQAYGNALANIGTTIGGAVQQATDPNRQLATLKIGEAKRDVQARSALGQIISQTPHVDDNGVSIYDLPTISAKLEQAGFGDHVADVTTQLKGINDAFRGEQQAKLATVTRGAQALLQANSDPDLTLNFIDQLEKNHSWPSGQLDAYRQMIQKDPSKTTAILQQFAGPQKDEILPEGGTALDPLTRKVVATGTPKPPTETELALKAAGGDAKGAMAILKPPPRDGYEQKSVLLDGKPAMVNYDNKTGKSLDATGNDVSARVRPIPPAAIQVQNLTNGQQLPAWATDDSRPSGADGNKFDSSVGMTPNGLYQAAVTWMQTGQFPPTGMGSSPRSQNVRAAITSKVGAIAASSGVDVPTLRAFYKSNSSSLTQQQKFYDSAQAFLTTADKNSALLDGVLPKIPDLGSPLLNVPVRALSQKALGSVDVSQFRTYLTSVQNEYGKILNNPNLSGQLTDSARSEAQQLVSADATAAQVIGSLQALRNEGGNRLQSIGDQIRTIQGRLSNPAGASQTPAPAPKGRFNPVTGKVEPIQ